jgi:hypothetical protein
MLIADRWGNIVFDAQNIPPDDAAKGWNGTYKGKKQQIEVYGYYIKIKYRDGSTEILKGNVTLLE